MKVYTKLMIGFGSVWIVLVLMTVVTILTLQSDSTAMEVAFHSNFESILYCDRMKTSIDDLNRVTLSAVWLHTPLSAAAVDKAWEDYRGGKEGQRRNITLPGEAELTANLFRLADQYYEEILTFTAAPEPAREQIYRDKLLARSLEARNAAQAVADLNLSHLRVVEGQLRRNFIQVRSLQLLLVVAGGALAVVCGLVLARTILRPLRVLTESAREIESGNLDLTVPVRRQDELGELAAAFNAMADKLREYRRIDHARLLRTQQTTQLAIDSLPDAVAVFSPAGEVEISNEQARLHFGLMPGRRQSDAQLEWLSHLFTDALKTGRPVEPLGYHSAIQLFDHGEERFLLPRSVPMLGEQRQIIGVVVILVDVTRLHQADELKSGLMATVSHELKTPLAATRFSVHLLAKESVSPLSDQQRKLVSAACEGADRLHRIIDNLLQFHRIDEGQYAVRTTPMAPLAIVNQATDPLRQEFVNAGLELAIEVPPALPPVLADPDLIGYVLSNLLSNALKFVPRGGRVTISVREEEKSVRFTVTDTGPGVEAEHLPKLFDRFYRAGAPRTTPGVGLGLAIARQLVEVHQGHIFAEAAPGCGLRISFELPTDHRMDDRLK